MTPHCMNLSGCIHRGWWDRDSGSHGYPRLTGLQVTFPFLCIRSQIIFSERVFYSYIGEKKLSMGKKENHTPSQQLTKRFNNA